MGGQSNMGGASTPQGIQANMGPGSMPAAGGMSGGFDLAKLFAGNAPASGGMPAAPLPQITQPQRPNIGLPPSRPLPQPPVAMPQQPAPPRKMTFLEKLQERRQGR